MIIGLKILKIAVVNKSILGENTYNTYITLFLGCFVMATIQVLMCVEYITLSEKKIVVSWMFIPITKVMIDENDKIRICCGVVTNEFMKNVKYMRIESACYGQFSDTETAEVDMTRNIGEFIFAKKAGKSVQIPMNEKYVEGIKEYYNCEIIHKN